MRDQLNSGQCARFLRALADPERLKIVQSLGGGPRTVSEICGQLESPLANVSHHLKQLRLAGLVRGHKKGRHILYCLAPDILGRVEGQRLNVLDFGCCRIELGRR